MSGIVAARWWIVLGLLLGIQGDVSTLVHPGWHHDGYSLMGLVAMGFAAVALSRG